MANRRAGTLAAMKALSARDEAVAPQRSVLRKVESLVRVLSQLMERDPEQEVAGIALPVLAEVIELARSFVADDPVVMAMQEIISPELIAANETVRAADALLVAAQLRTALTEFRPSGDVR